MNEEFNEIIQNHIFEIYECKDRNTLSELYRILYDKFKNFENRKKLINQQERIEIITALGNKIELIIQKENHRSVSPDHYSYYIISVKIDEKDFLRYSFHSEKLKL